MRIQPLILAVLIGCDTDKSDDTDTRDSDILTDTGCGTYIESESIDTDLTAADIESLMADYGVSEASELGCEQVCESMTMLYGGDITECALSIDEPEDTGDVLSGAIACTMEIYYPCGRRPQGLLTESGDCEVDLGGFLAHCAHMEAASVLAFSDLARQLADLGAPAALIERCRTAACEEADHARVMRRLAEQHGGTVAEPRQEPAADDLEAIARLNATEGCVWETWAALVCGWQARHAHDPALRAALGRIAEDEAGHAQLAWDLHVWLLARLSPAARDRVEAARTDALADLPAQALRHARFIPAPLGMPAPDRCAAMASQLRDGLLAA